MANSRFKKWWIAGIALTVVAVVGAFWRFRNQASEKPDGITMDVEDILFAVLDRNQTPESRDYIQNKFYLLIKA